MKKFISIATFCAMMIVAPLIAHATSITGSDGVNLTFPSTGATTLVGATSFTWTTSGTSGAGTIDFAAIPGGVNVTGSHKIYFCAGCLGGATSATPFTFTIGSYGTFVATTDASVFFAGYTSPSHTTSAASYGISGIFSPSGTLSAAGFAPTSADVTFAVTQSGGTYTGTYSLTSPSTAIPNPAPEPSSLALLGTGLLGAVGMIRRRVKA